MRKIRIVALQGPMDKIDSPVTVAKNMEWTVDKIRGLAAYHPDIICLAEAFAMVGVSIKVREFAETTSGPTVRTMRALARELGIAIICPMYEKRGQKIFNTALAIDKKGRIAGRYDKIRPTEGEIDEGTVPGRTKPTVVTLDGLKVGFQICYDANWPQEWLDVKRGGAELIFFCSAFSGGTLVMAQAASLNVPVVAATWCRHCRIYDRTGRMVAHQTPYFDYAMADILVRQPLFHLDGQWQKLDRIRRNHPELTTEVFDGEGRWAFGGTTDPNKLQKIIDRYGLVDVDDYLARAQKKQDHARR